MEGYGEGQKRKGIEKSEVRGRNEENEDAAANSLVLSKCALHYIAGVQLRVLPGVHVT